MKSDVNFHIHTTHSDGGKTVAEIVAGLKASGVKFFSVTDHDQVQGNAEAEKLARQNGLTHINGVELSSCFNGEIGFDATYVCHIVGLVIDRAKMQRELDKIAAAKDKKMTELFNALIADGYKLKKENVYQDGRIRTRTRIGYELVRTGYAKDNNEAFLKILNSEKYRKYAENLPVIREAVMIIHACGGIAVWAHPFGVTRGGKKELTKEQVTALSESMSAYGIDAVEVYYQEYSAEKIRFLQELAEKMNLPKSIATDYHGVDPAHEKNPEYIGKELREQLHFEKDGIVPDAGIKKLIKKKRLEQIERELTRRDIFGKEIERLYKEKTALTGND